MILGACGPREFYVSLRNHMEIDMSPEANVRLVLEYFDGCNTGDIEQMKKTLADNVVHFFLPKVHPPIRGSEQGGRYGGKFEEGYRATWRIDRTRAAGREGVSDWRCAYTVPWSGLRKVFGGTEGHVMEGGCDGAVQAW